MLEHSLNMGESDMARGTESEVGRRVADHGIDDALRCEFWAFMHADDVWRGEVAALVAMDVVRESDWPEAAPPDGMASGLALGQPKFKTPMEEQLVSAEVVDIEGGRGRPR